MKVSEIMSAGLVSCTNAESAQHVAGKLENQDVSIVPVVSEISATFIGTVTTRDLCKEMAANPKNPQDISIESVLNEHPASCSPEDEAEKAFEIMELNRVYELPVLTDNKVVGIVTMKDLLNNGVSVSNAKSEADKLGQCTDPSKNEDDEATFIAPGEDEPCI